MFLLVLSLLAYFASGISLTLFNKYLVTAAHYGFTFPITLIFIHMCTNCFFSGLALKCVFNEQLRNSPFHPRNITRRAFFTKFVPIGILFGADITLTNVAFRFASVSLTEVVKSAIPALIFLQNIFRGSDRTTSTALRAAKVLNVLLICAGVALTAAGEVGFEMSGFVAAVAATITATVKLVLMENLLNTVTVDLPAHGSAAAADEAGTLHSGNASLTIGDQQHDEPQLVLSDGRDHGSSKTRQSPPSPSLHSSRHHGGGDGGLVSSDSMDDLGAAAHTSVVRRGSTPSGNGNGRVFSQGSSGAAGGAGSGHVMGKSYTKVNTRGDGDDDAARVGDSSAENGRSSPTTTRIDVQSSASPEAVMPPNRSSSPLGGSGRVLVHGVHGNRLHPILSLLYFTPVSAVSLLPLQLWLENPRLQSSKFVDAGVWEPTVALIAFGSIMAFALNSSELFVLRETSALTLCIFGVLKFLLVVALSAVAFNQSFTHMNQAGIALTVLALITYNWIKYHEIKEAARMADLAEGRASEPGSPVDVGSAGSLNSGGGGGLASVSLHHHHHHQTSSPIATRKGSGAVTFGRGLLHPSLSDSSGSSSSSSSNSSVGSVEALLPRGSPSFKQRSGTSTTGSVHPHPNGSSSSAPGSNNVEDIGSRLLHAFAAAELLDSRHGDTSDDDLMAALEDGQSNRRRDTVESSETDADTHQ